ncbi:MAG: hypothetical protein WB661_02585 [Candidatus Bathyarchaeia archaeon]
MVGSRASLVGLCHIANRRNPQTLTTRFQPFPFFFRFCDEFLLSISGNHDDNHLYVCGNYAGPWTNATGGTWLVPGQALWIYVATATRIEWFFQAVE